MVTRLIEVTPSARAGKKLTAVFERDGRRLTRHFGAAGMGDFTLYHARDGPQVARARRRAYLARHRHGGEDWRDPTTPGALSRWILWERPTVAEAVRAYRRRFKI